MGQNRRYDMLGKDFDRFERQEATRPRPVGLTNEQVGAGRQDAVEPVPVRAWAPHLVAYVEQRLVEGVAVAWTRDAVLVRMGDDTYVWVWASGVRRVD